MCRCWSTNFACRNSGVFHLDRRWLRVSTPPAARLWLSGDADIYKTPYHLLQHQYPCVAYGCFGVLDVNKCQSLTGVKLAGTQSSSPLLTLPAVAVYRQAAGGREYRL